MLKEIILPDLGEGIEGAEVSEVSVAPGDTIQLDDTILVLESDKASMEIPAELNGVVKEVSVTVGEEIKTGQLLMKIDVTESLNEEPEPPAIEKEPKLPKKIEVGVPVETVIDYVENDIQSGDSVFASPGVRRLARELGINLKIINGSGAKGRITKDDLNGYIKLQMAISSGRIQSPQPEIDFSQWGEIEIKKLTRIKRITGERLQQAWQTIPHVTQFDEADITELDALRKEMKVTGLEKNIKVTFLPFLMKAAAVVLREMEEFNSSLDHTSKYLVLKNYYHIGIAVNTPSGLMVPVVNNVDQKSILELSAELMDLSSRAREKKLKPDEMKGGTFTISSLGGIGGTGFSPIVNPPEVAIMGVSRSVWKQTFNERGDSFSPRFMMPFSLSYDHRVIDGAAAAAFSSRFAAVLADTEYYKEEK